MAPTRLRAWLAFAAVAALHLVLSAPEELSTYIVHMDSSAMPSAFAGPRGWYAATLQSAAASTTTSAGDNQLVYVYDTAVHGFSALLSPSHLRKLQGSPGFVSAHRDALVRKPDTTHTPEFLHLDPASGLWPASRLGEDVIIGVVDSGVWPESDSFRDAGMGEVPARWKGACEEGTAFTPAMCNRKLVGARFFNRGLLATFPNATIPVNSPRDPDGHGTHTSSIAAGALAGGASYFGYAAGTARGVAPRARVAVYKVLWDEAAFVSDILAGIDRAVADGVDVLSISLGQDGVPMDRDPVAVASFGAMERGVFVATSAGNRGPWLGGLHNGAPRQLTVGASTVDREFSGKVELGNGITIVGSSLYPVAAATRRRLPLVFVGACNNRTSLAMAGDKIVACEDDGNPASVGPAGVAGGLLVISGSPSVEYDVRFPVPAAVISPEDGRTILDYIRRSGSDATARLRFQEITLGTRPAPAVATYSSRGPSQICPAVVKPDLVAPGSLVLAAWPPNAAAAAVGARLLYAPYNILSGTSMACPHAAGVAALLRAAHPGWSPAAIRSAMMTTADAVDNTLQPIKDLGEQRRPATPLAMGSGHLNPNRAMDPGLVYDAGPGDYVKLLCAMAYTKKEIQSITRSPEADCSGASLDLNYPSFIASLMENQTAAAAVWVFRRTVTNVGEGMWTYRAKVTPIKGFSITVAPEVLVFREKDEKQSFVLTVERHVGIKVDEGVVVYGWLSWEDDQGKHRVRSPIVVTT